MSAAVLKLLHDSTSLGTVVWFAARDWATMLLVIWTAAIAVFVDSNLVARFLWIPISLGLAGVLGSIVMLAIPANIMLAANVATLVLFVVAFEVLKKPRPTPALNQRHR